MKRRHGFFLATALGLAAIAGSYAAMQTTDLGAQAATVSEKEIAAADLRLDKQEAALQRAAKKRPPRLPKLPAKAARPVGGAADVAPAAAAPSGTSSGALSAGNPSPGSYDDHGGDDDLDDDAADEDREDHLDDLEDAPRGRGGPLERRR